MPDAVVPVAASAVADAGPTPLVTAEDLPEFLRFLVTHEVLGVEVYRLAVLFGVVAAATVVSVIVRYFFDRRLARLEPGEFGAPDVSAPDGGHPVGQLYILLKSARRPAQLAIWGVAFLLGGPALGGSFFVPAMRAAQALFSLSVALFAYNLVELLELYLRRWLQNTTVALHDMLVPAIRKAIRVLILLFAGMHIYQSFSGQELTTIIAGFGISGVAFALAAQDSLKNIFAFLSILVARPFQPGDRIILDEHDGVVETVGFGATHLRRLDGHLVIIPNTQLTGRVIHNVQRRPFIKRSLTIGLTYDTPPAKVEEAVAILKDILHDHEGMRADHPPRVHFAEFNADNLGISVTYWYHPPEYWSYMAFSERVNLEILRRFGAAGIEFAFPTQTVFLAGDRARPVVMAPGAGGAPHA